MVSSLNAVHLDSFATISFYVQTKQRDCSDAHLASIVPTKTNKRNIYRSVFQKDFFLLFFGKSAEVWLLSTNGVSQQLIFETIIRSFNCIINSKSRQTFSQKKAPKYNPSMQTISL